MPRNPSTGIYTRVDNSFSDPVLGEVINPTDAIDLWEDLTDAVNTIPASVLGPGVDTEFYTPEDYDAAGDAIFIDASDVSITSGDNTLTVIGANFIEANEGKSIIVAGAGAAGIPLSSIIDNVLSATQVELHDNAATSLTNDPAVVVYGTDDTNAFLAAAAAIQAGTVRNFAHSKTATGYLVWPTAASVAANTQIFTLTGIEGLRYDFAGVPLYVGCPSQPTSYLFFINDSQGIEINSPTGYAMQGRLVPGGPTAGLTWLYFKQTTDIQLLNVDLSGGGLGVQFGKGFSASATYCSNIDITGTFTEVFYPYQATLDGIQVRLDINTIRCGRPMIFGNVYDVVGTVRVTDCVTQVMMLNYGHATDRSNNRMSDIKLKLIDHDSTVNWVSVFQAHSQGDLVVPNIATTFEGIEIEFDVILPAIGGNILLFTGNTSVGTLGSLTPGDLAGNRNYTTISGVVNGRATTTNIIQLNPAAGGFSNSQAHFTIENFLCPDQITQPILVGATAKTTMFNVDMPILPAFEAVVVPDNHKWVDVNFPKSGLTTTERWSSPTRFLDPTASVSSPVAIFQGGSTRWIDRTNQLAGAVDVTPTEIIIQAHGTHDIELQTDGGTSRLKVLRSTGELQPSGTTKTTPLGDATHVFSNLHTVLATLYGSASGVITIGGQAAAGTYNFNLPTGAGTAGQPLLSGGGGAAAQTYGTLGIAAGGTGAISAAAALIALGALGNVKLQVFTATGTYTPSTGMIAALGFTIGAGGGGAGCAGTAGTTQPAGAGGAGSPSIKIMTAADVGASKAVTIGAGGGGGASGANNGAAGGDTSIGTLCIGKGGSGGQFAQNLVQNGSSGLGGVAGTGTITGTGAPGVSALGSFNASTGVYAGTGGSTMLGGGGKGGLGSNGSAGTGYGSGGGGGGSYDASSFAGGNGAQGIAFVLEFCNQ